MQGMCQKSVVVFKIMKNSEIDKESVNLDKLNNDIFDKNGRRTLSK